MRILHDDNELSADKILEASMQLPCEKTVGVYRNMTARLSMSAMKWKALKEQAGETFDKDAEVFREINFDYWEHAFTWKN